MNTEVIEQLGTGINDSFFLIGIAMLGIEIIKGLVDKAFKWNDFANILVNISTQIPFLFIEIFIVSFAYSAFFILANELIYWQFQINAWSIVAAVLIADLIYYWEHRWAHTIRLLWVNHAVHHSSPVMNTSVGVRFGPFEGVWSMLMLLPMVLMGFPVSLIIFGSLVVLAYQTWIHTELIGKLGWVEQVLNTPSHHRVHHGSNAAYLDKNFGGILIIWDKLFGTFAEEKQTPTYGILPALETNHPFKVWFSEVPALYQDLKNSTNAQQFINTLFKPPSGRNH